jgi:hypothetical protein
MKKNYTLITVLGWEQRFIDGSKQIFNNYDIKNVILISFTDYYHMKNMHENLSNFESLLLEKKVESENIKLEYENSVQNWQILDTYFENYNPHNNILLNFTNIPRETIWALLFFLRNKVNELSYIYYKPESYDNSNGGLTKNHKNPRLLFKHSGIFDINKKLAIIIFTGFDQKRMDLLIEYYEPSKIIYLSQDGDQFENIQRNSGLSQNTTFENIEISSFEINTYDIDETQLLLNEIINSNETLNIIIASLGPKTSAISSYGAYFKNRKIGLTYVPAREYSGEYSRGFNPIPLVGNFKFN